jgi:hypothetical protein
LETDWALPDGFSGDGSLAAIQGNTGDVVVRDLEHRRAIASVANYSGGLSPGAQLVSGLALDASGSRLAVAESEGGLQLAPGAAVFPAPVEGIQFYDLAHRVTAVGAGNLARCAASDRGYVSFSADGRRVVGVNACGEGVLWDARSGRQLRTFNAGVSTVTAISLDTHGRLLALASPDRTVTVRNLNGNQTAFVLRGDTAPINDVAFNPAGTWIATASQDHEVRIWNAANGQLLRILPDSSDVTSVSFTPNGTRVITTDSQGIIRVQDACGLCGNAQGLLRLGASRITRQLTPAERRTFGL